MIRPFGRGYFIDISVRVFKADWYSVAEFKYNGVDGSGQAVSGVVTAADRRAAVSMLAAQDYFPAQLDESSAETAAVDVSQSLTSIKSGLAFGSGRVTTKDVLTFTTQLATAINAGLPLHNAIDIINQQQQKTAMRNLLKSLADDVSGGDSLSDAMAKHPRIFSNLYVSMIRVGETGGILDQTVKQLALLLERDEKVRTNLKNASAYPIFIMIVGIVSVIIVLVAILPKIVDTIGSPDMLPLPTRMLLATSDILVRYGWMMLIVFLAGAASFMKWKCTASGKLSLDTFKLKIPILGSVLIAIAVGRFARTLGALTQSGITILKALYVVRDTVGNELLSRQIDSVAEKVKMGQPLAEPLAQSGYFPQLLIQIVSIGEQTGRLDELLLNAADTFDDQADAAVTKFMAVFPPALIIILAVIIGFIIAATLLPLIAMELSGSGI
jgi:type II secretory pathway component PulF